MGLWNMLTQKEEERGETTNMHRDQRVVESLGGNTATTAVVFRWSLEGVGVLFSLGACEVTWSLGHVIQKFMGAHCFPSFGKGGIVSLPNFPNMLHINLMQVSQCAKCIFHSKCNTGSLLRLFPKSEILMHCLVLQHFLYKIHILYLRSDQVQIPVFPCKEYVYALVHADVVLYMKFILILMFTYGIPSKFILDHTCAAKTPSFHLSLCNSISTL